MAHSEIRSIGTRSLCALGALLTVVVILSGSAPVLGIRPAARAEASGIAVTPPPTPEVPVAAVERSPRSDEQTVPTRDPGDGPEPRGEVQTTTTIAPTPQVDPLANPVVMLYGDSLAWEARNVFEQALADHSDLTVITRTFGGTAICDWLDEMADDATTLMPGLVVIEFVGNNFTQCMEDPAGGALVGAALVERYAIDAEAAIATFAATGTQVVFAGAPVSYPGMASLDSHEAPLNAIYEALGERHEGVHYVDAGADVLDDGEWTATLPCLPLEPCTGTDATSGTAFNPVRAPDGLHFCPASDDAIRGVTGDCPVWSSGAFRYGTALAQPVLESLEAAAASPVDVA